MPLTPVVLRKIPTAYLGSIEEIWYYSAQSALCIGRLILIACSMIACSIHSTIHLNLSKQTSTQMEYSMFLGDPIVPTMSIRQIIRLNGSS